MQIIRKIRVEEKINLIWVRKQNFNYSRTGPLLPRSDFRIKRKNVHIQLHTRDVNPLLRKHLLDYKFRFLLRENVMTSIELKEVVC